MSKTTTAEVDQVFKAYNHLLDGATFDVIERLPVMDKETRLQVNAIIRKHLVNAFQEISQLSVKG